MLKKRTAIFMILCAAVLTVVGWAFDWGVGAGADYVHEIRKNIEIFGLVYQEISRKYVEPVDPDKFMKAGINGMLGTLDPYTVLIEKEDNAQLQIMTHGKYGGVGMMIGVRDGWPTVVEQPYEGTPALKAGIREGDRIIEVDGTSTKGMDVNEVANRLRGEVGTAVTIKIAREGEPQPLEFHLIRAEITIHDVTYAGMIHDGIGYIKLSRFSKNAGYEVNQAIRDLKAQGLKALILDLRSNPGGLLESAVEVAENFVKKGDLIVSTKGRIEGSDKEYRSEKAPILGALPLVVLVNRMSASASEIVAGAIQDLDRGVIVGEPTFGKGLVQTVVSLTRESALKITTAKYYIPSGRLIQKERAQPDDEDNLFASAASEESVDLSREPEAAKSDKNAGKTSLQVFRTKGGRAVYGGGGIEPDVMVPPEKLTRFDEALSRQAVLFNFAVAYVSKHPTLKRDFEIDDNVLAEFRQFLRDKKFTYTSQSEMQLTELKKVAANEGYLGDIQSSLTSLEQTLQREKENDFVRSQNYIRRALEREIAAKAFGSKAQVEVTFDDDLVIKKAVEMLQNPEAYNAILSGDKTKK
ncbi:MAG: S41 family peptidase [candidate division KSB1 bacterium]|nr:S41 family peptidase [candidate division KSB1 bacterium]MDZ7303773.1 S41 family peptidase [candidate division KSB1 bacterium]MDZ7313032.1 S41 family peptidase [candidate division KSB1 bacterium]